MNLLSLSDAGTGDPWLAPAAEETRGNNVDAFFNADTVEEDYCTGEGWGPGFNAAEGDFRARITAPHRFDYAYDVDTTRLDYDQCRDALAPIPVGNVALNAKIVQGFYATNWLHDLFYLAGYDEAAGNSQADNYGRGGLAGDPLLVHAASLSTFTYAPTDGESPALTLGYNTQSRSHRDVSAFDLGVLAHEWGHTMFGRLTTSDYYGQPGAINEGTADFVGLFVTVREQDRWAMPGEPAFSAAYAVGAYMNLDYDFSGDDLPVAGSPTNPDNSYYHGIRRYPYSSDLNRNPLTLRHISQDNPVPAGSQPFDWKARSLVNAEIHTAGEVWTTALWHCARNVLAATAPGQSETRRNDFLRWLVGGLQLFPTDATYTEARNALLFAIRADSEADYRRCRSGFAERGFGAGALSPPRKSFSLRGVEESFRDVDHALSIVDLSLREIGGDGDGVLDRGEDGEVRVTLHNSGFAPLARITLAVPPIPGLYDLPGQAVVQDVALAPEETRVIALPLRVRRGHGPLTVPVQAFAWDEAHPLAFALQSRPFEVNYDLRRDRSIDSLAHPATFAADWIRGFDDYPHGCALYVCLGAEGDALADVLDWQRRRYNGSWAYVMSDPQLSLNTWLATQPFTVSATAPLEFLLRHDYDFDRSPTTPGYGRIEIRIDGGDWQDAAPLLTAGSAAFGGISGGWRDDSLRFDASLAGRQVQLRLRTRVISTFRANDAHWAIARAEIRGAAQPVFSSVVADQ
nr:M36 family metallopeptidase [Tahibacter caeni]